MELKQKLKKMATSVEWKKGNWRVGSAKAPELGLTFGNITNYGEFELFSLIGFDYKDDKKD